MRIAWEALKSITQHVCYFETVEMEHIKFKSMIHVSNTQKKEEYTEKNVSRIKKKKEKEKNETKTALT